MGVSAAFKTLWGKAYVVGLICPPLIGIGLTYSVKLTSGPVRLHVFMAPLAEYLLLLYLWYQIVQTTILILYDLLEILTGSCITLTHRGIKWSLRISLQWLSEPRLSNLFICITFITKYWIGIQGKLKIRSQNLIFMFHVLIDSNFGLALLLQ